jgi:hypothetical protein
VGISERALIHAVKDLARAQTGGAWIAGNQGVEPPQPPGGFVTLVSLRPLGRGERSNVVNAEEPLDIDVTLREIFSAVLQVESRGEDAFNAVASVIAGAKLAGSLVTEKAGGACLGFARASEIRNVSTPVSDRWEYRAVADLTFNVFGEFTETIPTIQSIDVIGNGETQSIEVP